MITLKARTENEAKAEAIELSLAHPGQYVLVHADFGAVATLHKRLPAQAPSDSPFNWYALNGKTRTFTEAQHVANQLATPDMS